MHILHTYTHQKCTALHAQYTYMLLTYTYHMPHIICISHHNILHITHTPSYINTLYVDIYHISTSYTYITPYPMPHTCTYHIHPHISIIHTTHAHTLYIRKPGLCMQWLGCKVSFSLPSPGNASIKPCCPHPQLLGRGA